MGKKLSEFDKGVIHGIALACSTIMAAYDETTCVAYAIGAAGLTREKMKRAGVEDYDLRKLAPAFADLRAEQRRKPQR